MPAFFLILSGQVTQIASINTEDNTFNIAHPEANNEDATSTTDVVPNELKVANKVLPRRKLIRNKIILCIMIVSSLLLGFWAWEVPAIGYKHCKNCECCHHHSLFKGHNVIVHIVVLNCQKCNQCQVSGHNSLGVFLNLWVWNFFWKLGTFPKIWNISDNQVFLKTRIVFKDIRIFFQKCDFFRKF